MSQKIESDSSTPLQIQPILLYQEVGDKIGKVEYVQHMGNDSTVVNSARVSFGAHKEHLDSKDYKLIKYLVKNQHTSTLEHNVITFRITAPLFVRSQHMRHRTWSYNEISRRYTSLDIQFYEPLAFRTQHKSNRQASNPNQLIDPEIAVSQNFYFYSKQTKTHGEQTSVKVSSASDAIKNHHKKSLTLYESLIQAGVSREQARGVLPQNLYSQYYATVNLNNLIKFIKLRLHEGAQWEIQQLAKAFIAIASEIWPNIFPLSLK